MLKPLPNKGFVDKISNVLRFFLRVQHASGLAEDLDDLQRGAAADGLRDFWLVDVVGASDPLTVDVMQFLHEPHRICGFGIGVEPSNFKIGLGAAFRS